MSSLSSLLSSSKPPSKPLKLDPKLWGPGAWMAIHQIKRDKDKNKDKNTANELRQYLMDKHNIDSYIKNMNK